MRRLIIFLFLLLLAVNGLMAWQNWKAEAATGNSCTRLVCSLQMERSDSGTLMLPGAWVYIN